MTPTQSDTNPMNAANAAPRCSASVQRELLLDYDSRKLEDLEFGETGIFVARSLCEAEKKIFLSPHARPTHQGTNEGVLLMEVTMAERRSLAITLVEPQDISKLQQATDSFVKRLLGELGGFEGRKPDRYFKVTSFQACKKIVSPCMNGMLCREVIGTKISEKYYRVSGIDGFDNLRELVASLSARGWLEEE